MLPAANRLRRSPDFAAVFRSGRRATSRHLVIHLLTADRATTDAPEPADELVRTRSLRPPRAGFVVSGKVGNSVVRHRITRRLRPLVRERLIALPPNTDIVIRALPAAAAADSAELAASLDTGLRAAARKAGLVGSTS